jgi:hypothetical protein
MTDIVVKTLGENLLDEQAIEPVRMRLAEGKPLDQALLIGGLLEEEVFRLPAKRFKCPWR